MSELNPNHAVTSAVRPLWQKLAAIAVMKAGGHVVISVQDLERFPSNGALTIQELEDGIHLRIVDAATAAELAKREGGLPV